MLKILISIFLFIKVLGFSVWAIDYTSFLTSMTSFKDGDTSFVNAKKDNGEVPNVDLNFQPKSIASIDSVLVFSDEKNIIDPVSFKKGLSSYIELDRFEKNELPEELSTEFLELFHVTRNHTVDSVAQLVKDVYAPFIKTILEDPKVQQARIGQFKQRDVFTFESTKGKTISLTALDLKKLYESAFFYIPYVYDVTYKFEKEKIIKDGKKQIRKRSSLSIQAGVLWYQIRINEDSSVDIVFLKNLTASSFDSEIYLKDRSEKSVLAELIQHSQGKLGVDFLVQTKQLQPFKLVGRINNVKRNSYNLKFPVDNGLAVDDFYWIMENSEQESGINSQQKGLLYLKDKGVKDHDGTYAVAGYQVYGTHDHLSSWVKEAPRYGVQLGLGFSHRENFYISALDSTVNGRQLFSNNLQSAFSVVGNVGIFVGRWFGKRQYMLEFDGSISFPSVDIDDDSLFNSAILYDFYVGIRKKYWLGQLAVEPFLRLGEHGFNLYLSNDDYFYMNTMACKIGVHIEKMVRPFLMVGGSLFTTITFGEPGIDYDVDFIEGSQTATRSRLNWTGFMLTLDWIK